MNFIDVIDCPKTPIMMKKRKSSDNDVQSESICPGAPYKQRIVQDHPEQKNENQDLFRNRARRKLYFESEPEI